MFVFSLFFLCYDGVAIDNIAYFVLFSILLLSFVVMSLSIPVSVCMVLLCSLIYVLLYMRSMLSYDVHIILLFVVLALSLFVLPFVVLALSCSYIGWVPSVMLLMLVRPSLVLLFLLLYVCVICMVMVIFSVFVRLSLACK